MENNVTRLLTHEKALRRFPVNYRHDEFLQLRLIIDRACKEKRVDLNRFELVLPVRPTLTQLALISKKGIF